MNKDKIIETTLKDCYIINQNIYRDERGFFSPYYVESELKTIGFEGIKQANVSCSKKGTIRGLHFQKGDAAQAKLVKVLRGKAFVVLVDLREDSPTCKSWIDIILTEDSDMMVYVPKGFAHGFLALTDNMLYQYFVDNDYCPEAESGIAYDSPSLNIPWDKIKEIYDIDEFILYEKDKEWEVLK